MRLAVDRAAELRALVNCRDVPATIATRARIVLWSAEGKRCKDIAVLAAVSLPTVDRWLGRYGEFGLSGLVDLSHAAPRQQVPGWVPGRILALTRATPPRNAPTTTNATAWPTCSRNVATGEVIGDCYPRRTAADFLDFMRKAVRPYAGKEIHVVLDNLSTHDTPEVKAWLAANPNVTFHFNPVGSSWMNMVETWFGIITKQSIRRGTFTSVNALILRIRDYIKHCNADAKSFTWTATAGEILAEVRWVQSSVRQLLDNNSK